MARPVSDIEKELKTARWLIRHGQVDKANEHIAAAQMMGYVSNGKMKYLKELAKQFGKPTKGGM